MIDGENPTFVEHMIMQYTGCTHERARKVESLMRTLTTRRLGDMNLLRFETLAIEAETGVAILEGETS